MFKLMDKKIIASLRSNIVATYSYCSIASQMDMQVTSHSVSLKLLEGNIILPYNLKNVKVPSYHSIYENACKLQQNIFD